MGLHSDDNLSFKYEWVDFLCKSISGSKNRVNSLFNYLKLEPNFMQDFSETNGISMSYAHINSIFCCKIVGVTVT